MRSVTGYMDSVDWVHHYCPFGMPLLPAVNTELKTIYLFRPVPCGTWRSQREQCAYDPRLPAQRPLVASSRLRTFRLLLACWIYSQMIP